MIGNIIRYSQLFALFLIGFGLALWPYAPAFLPKVDIVQTIGVTISLIISLVVSYEFLYARNVQNSKGIFPEDLSKAITRAYKWAGRPKTARVFAVTSNMIQPICRISNIIVSEYKILIYAPNTPVCDQNNELFSNLQMTEKEWLSLQNDNPEIQNMTLDTFKNFPTEYFIIFDDKSMVHGTYIHTGKPEPHCKVPEPFVYLNSNAAFVKLIRGKIELFESIKSYSRSNCVK